MVHEMNPYAMSSPPQKANFSARLFSLAIVVYVVAWAVGFLFVAKDFGLQGAIALSSLPMILLLVSFRMRLRWDRVNAFDFFPLGFIALFVGFGVWTLIQSWYSAGYHLRPEGWVLYHPPSQEDLDWKAFGLAFAKDPAFRGLNMQHFRGVYWLSGSLKNEAELDRLLELAKLHGIKDRRLDGPYGHSISITIPNTSRAVRYDAPGY